MMDDMSHKCGIHMKKDMLPRVYWVGSKKSLDPLAEWCG